MAYTVACINQTKGSLVLKVDGKPYFDFGPVGGGTFHRLDSQVPALSFGPLTKRDLLMGRSWCFGFEHAQEVGLIVPACRRHPNSGKSLWKLNLNKALYSPVHTVK